MSDVPSYDFDRNKQAGYEIQVLTSVAYQPIDDVSLPLDVSVASKVFSARFIGTLLDQRTLPLQVHVHSVYHPVPFIHNMY